MYVGKSEWTHLRGKVPVHVCNKFSMTVLRTKMGIISIGLVGSDIKEMRNVPSNHRHVLCYDGTGILAGDGGRANKREGKGFRTGDKVNLYVDIKTGEVTWIVNNMKQATYKWDQLQDRSINWFFCI